ncbi:pentapeptide repeat-containing protein [Solicola sp. PLA-1-18]|uniref:pentapeptide repeat-containing protein n=1 Tax=Solicola sp. PLA-1-18 TaxID=3380532 RepID=UPI003B80A42E
MTRAPGAGTDRDTLHADCSSCLGLCCVALPFARSVDFAIDKASGEPCRNLDEHLGCGIHDRLRESGFRGCTVYDCLGAGQKVTQVVLAGQDWRSSPDTASRMFAVFGVVRQLHELLWLLADARGRDLPADLHADLRHADDAIEALTRADADVVLAADLDAWHRDVDVLLARTSRSVRGDDGADHRRADLLGARLRGADLRDADLRGALLIAADLRGADLRRADLVGADLRDTDLRAADLTDALFLTQPQLIAARGDASTRLPGWLSTPSHWPT